MSKDGLIVAAPMADGEALHWWRVDDGEVVAAGQDADPLSAARIEIAADGEQRVMALLPAAATRIAWRSFVGLAPRQAEVAARMAAVEASIGGGDTNHAVALADGESDPQPTVAAVIDKGIMASTLARLQAIGIDPDVLLPSALVLPDDGAAARATIGGEDVLRASELATAHDPAIAPLLTDGPITEVATTRIPALLAASFASPALDLRQGLFAKRSRRQGLDRAQWRRLGILFAALLLLSLLVELVVLGRTVIATGSEDAAALAEVRKVVPDAPDLATGERRLDSQLAARGAGGASFTVPASALFAAMQATPGVAARSIDYRADGTLGTTLFAPSADAINAVLLALQARGYVVTANPRQDSTGSVVADITVRGS